MNSAIAYIVGRLREPSTWAGIAAGIAAIGWSLPADQWGAIVQAGMGAAGLAAVLLTDQKPE